MPTFSGPGGGPGSDTTAVHVDVAGEIAGVALKGLVSPGDLILIEDSTDANAKKRVTISSIQGGTTDTLLSLNPFLRGYISVTAATGSFGRSGLLAQTSTTSAGGATMTFDSDGRPRRQFATNTTPGNEAGWRGHNSLAMSEWGGNPEMMTRISIDSVADIRVFVGGTTQIAFLSGDGDDPATSYVGFQFSSGRPDTNWQFVRRDQSAGGPSQTIVDTGVVAAADVLLQFIVRRLTSGIAQVEIRDDTNASLYSATVLSNLPPVADVFQPQASVSNTGVTAKRIRVYDGAMNVRGSWT